MANPRSQRRSPGSLGRVSAPPAPRARRKLLIAVGVLIPLALLALAWFDGGERPLRPIAETVALPEQSR